MEHPSFFIDFEASGIASDSYPIEVVAVVSSNTTFHALIRPVSYWAFWSFDAQDMHGISRDDLNRSGIDTVVLAGHLNQLLSGQVLCSDSPQDRFWLDTLYEAAGLEPSFKLQPLESFVGRESASEIYRYLPARKQHRALPDALALMAAYDTFRRRWDAGNRDRVEVSWSNIVFSALSFLRSGLLGHQEARPNSSLAVIASASSVNITCAQRSLFMFEI
jgi:DNA polymerase III epsilon subunit-like protein